jgi:hypothetical protein
MCDCSLLPTSLHLYFGDVVMLSIHVPVSHFRLWFIVNIARPATGANCYYCSGTVQLNLTTNRHETDNMSSKSPNLTWSVLHSAVMRESVVDGSYTQCVRSRGSVSSGWRWGRISGWAIAFNLSCRRTRELYFICYGFWVLCYGFYRKLSLNMTQNNDLTLKLMSLRLHF